MILSMELKNIKEAITSLEREASKRHLALFANTLFTEWKTFCCKFFNQSGSVITYSYKRFRIDGKKNPGAFGIFKLASFLWLI